MINKILFALIFICFAVNLLGQQTTPGVELPDFVITGTDIISVDKAQKVPPEFVPTTSEQFFKPVYSPEDLEIKDLSSPLKEELNILDSLDFLRGYLDFRAGAYSLPVANLVYLFPIDNVMVEGRFAGAHHPAYVDNSERYLINGGVNIIYTVDNKSEVLPGTQIKFLSNLGSASYKFFGSVDPVRRTFNNGNFSLGVSNQSNRVFNFDFSVADDYSSINEENYTENLLGLRGFSRVNFSPLNISVNAEYKKQFLTIDDAVPNTPNPDVDDFFSVRPTAGLNISNTLKVSGGVTYASSGNNSYAAPYASIGLRLSRSLSLFGEYAPHAEFITPGRLLMINRYFDPQNFYNFFVKKRNLFTAAVKYEYDKYYQINFGLRFFNSPDYPYFHNVTSSERFVISSTDVEGLTFFTDLLYHLGPFGRLYGTIEWNETKDNFGKMIPYHPQIRAAVTYGYKFGFGLDSQIKLSYASKSYTIIDNSFSVPGYIDIGLDFEYTVVRNFLITFRVENMLGDDIYYWQGYKEAPVNIMGGFIYRW
jgi:hypothetical protein